MRGVVVAWLLLLALVMLVARLAVLVWRGALAGVGVFLALVLSLVVVLLVLLALVLILSVGYHLF